MKLEKEIKVLNIDVEKIKEKLCKIGAKFIGKKEQMIYTYDIASIKYRIYEALELVKSDNTLLQLTALEKLKIALEEFIDLIPVEKVDKILKETNLKNLLELDVEAAKKMSLSKCLQEELENININPNKWVRLRKSNEKVELTVKHILDKSEEKIQKVREYEINVSNLEETNRLLESIGLVKRNYQEKIRYSFTYKCADIEIDIWPMLEPYMEIECDDEKVIEEIITLLGLEDKRIVSLNTSKLYLEKGIDILKMPELKF